VWGQAYRERTPAGTSTYATLAHREAARDTQGVPGRIVGTCDSCGTEQPIWDLTKCHMCGKTVCRKCASFAYGRYFCSIRCAQYFFHGEGDEPGETDTT
jgi:hypothetical protein